MFMFGLYAVNVHKTEKWMPNHVVRQTHRGYAEEAQKCTSSVYDETRSRFLCGVCVCDKGEAYFNLYTL